MKEKTNGSHLRSYTRHDPRKEKGITIVTISDHARGTTQGKERKNAMGVISNYARGIISGMISQRKEDVPTSIFRGEAGSDAGGAPLKCILSWENKGKD